MKLYLDSPVEVELVKDQYEGGLSGPCSAETVTYEVEPPEHAEVTPIGTMVRVVGRKPGPCRMRGIATYSDGLPRQTNWIELIIEEIPTREVQVQAEAKLLGPALIDPFAP